MFRAACAAAMAGTEDVRAEDGRWVLVGDVGAVEPVEEEMEARAAPAA